jgi:hypothetical protein
MRVAAVGAGLPFDVSFAADDGFVVAWLVAKGENDGGAFNWDRMEWNERK